MSHITQVFAENTIGSRSRQAVEISEQDERGAVGICGKPVRTGESARLVQPFPPAKSQMSINDMHGTTIRRHVHRHRDTALATEKKRRTGKRSDLTKDEGKATHDRVTVLFVFPRPGSLKLTVPSKVIGDALSLIEAPRTMPDQVHFLQSDNVGG